MEKNKPGYAEAMAEVEAILEKFNQGAMDVDTLAAEVRRATELIRCCKERLAKAEREVNEVLNEENDGNEKSC